MARNPHIERLPYEPAALGRVDVDAPARLVAGSMATIRVTYTAGRFGIDDQGSIRFLFRFASDAGRPQFDRPGAPNYCTVSASNGTVLVPEYHPRGAFRPWFKAVRVNVMRDALHEGNRITLVLGDRSQGSAGWRLSTVREPRFEIRAQADPFGTVVYGDVAGGATLDLVAGLPHKWQLVIPTLRRVGDPFEVALRADDRCGNPVAHLDGAFHLEADGSVEGLPESVAANGPAVRVTGLRASAQGIVRIRVRDSAGELLAESNPLVVVEAPRLVTWWGDFHAQSEETVGTNSAREYFEFARDRAFCDFVGHQGNDFQISTAFWRELNDLYRDFHAPGRFVTIPGYEYSPVTFLGGDRNIFFFDDHRPIRRSSHALVEDISDIETDCNHVRDLFSALRGDRENALAFAHVGGRYADLRAGHDGEIERSVEVHSAWGTFEWLLFDAFDLGYRVGVVCNSDDHKGRPGASHPGASIFGAYGGLTCLYLEELTRASIWRCMKARHHYGTTGERMHLAVDAHFDDDALRYDSDPKIDSAAPGVATRTAMMGDIVGTREKSVRVVVRVDAPAPIERVDLRCGTRTIETLRPYSSEDVGRRIRVIWEGAEYRGRGRMTIWDGHLDMAGNRMAAFVPINFWHLEKALERTQTGLAWQSVTTGNFAGADILLENADDGSLYIASPHVNTTLAIRDIGFDDTVLDAGALERRMRVFRLPDVNTARSFAFERTVDIAAEGDTPIYVRVTLENGHQAWSSPIYLFRRAAP
ncbi:MAG: DUF3604 domain-containing protein [Burkholderiales bacterium]|nr:DUF3604 domain-containing protein [Burkholderiales bacterium]